MTTAYRAWSMRLLGSKMRGEEAAFPELGDTELDVAGLGGQCLWPVPVALGGARLGAFVEAGADLGGGLGFDQLLAHQADGFADQVDDFAALQCIGQLGQDRLIKGHRWSPPCAFGKEHTEDHTGGPTWWWTRRSPQSPPLDGTLTTRCTDNAAQERVELIRDRIAFCTPAFRRLDVLESHLHRPPIASGNLRDAHTVPHEHVLVLIQGGRLHVIAFGVGQRQLGVTVDL